MNPIKLSQTLQKTLVNYLATTFDVNRDGNEPALANALRHSFDTPGALFNGPFLELTPPYKTAGTLEDLAQVRVLTSRLLKMDCFQRGRPIPIDLPLYVHQEQAICKLISEQRNIVVSSGTGSGKTECFLIPILDDLVRDPAPGVRAVLIYPMNALVNDQLDRLRDLLRGTQFTFGRYTGELPADASEEERRRAVPNEVISRRQIWEDGKIPQILITNYAMLEYLLVRPKDDPLFNSGSWKFFVLDEAHTYVGAQGIEVSLLLRRLKHRLGHAPGETRCIATSATLTDDDASEAAQFARNLFGEHFTDEDIIFGQTDPDYAPQVKETYTVPAKAYVHEDFELLFKEVRKEDGSSTDEIALRMQEMKLISDAHLAVADRFQDPQTFLWHALKDNHDLIYLGQWMADQTEPIGARTAAEVLFRDRLDVEADQLDALYHLIELGSLARMASDEPSLLPARYHLFARAPQGIWVCLNPNCSGREHETDAAWSRLFATHHEYCDACELAVYPLAVCRTCGQVYVRMEEENGRLLGEAENIYVEPQPRYFTWTPIAENRAMADLEEDAEDELIQQSGTTSKLSQLEKTICLNCQQYADRCTCGDQRTKISLHLVVEMVKPPRNKKAKPQPRAVTLMNECGRCHDKGFKDQEIATLVSMIGNAPLSIIIQALYKELPAAVKIEASQKPGQGRKLLTFYDSRQGAARFAAYLQDSVNQRTYRHLIPKALTKLLNSQGFLPDIEMLSTECTQLAWDNKIFHNDPNIPDYDRKEVIPTIPRTASTINPISDLHQALAPFENLIMFCKSSGEIYHPSFGFARSAHR